ncbi:MAG: hypothetical protein Q8R97_12290 [Brevundimonas sp.]|nr:hypothetical protein [Brevundimonas sp.]MDP3401891.1 hypothetical protein [Brevundimonas sp.]MDZ4109859.1 hypothetical protein [Brevundimonas sp.]
MSDEIKSEALSESAERGVWETPILTRLDTEDAEVGAIVGPDFGFDS